MTKVRRKSTKKILTDINGITKGNFCEFHYPSKIKKNHITKKIVMEMSPRIKPLFSNFCLTDPYLFTDPYGQFWKTYSISVGVPMSKTIC